MLVELLYDDALSRKFVNMQIENPGGQGASLALF